MAKNLDSRYQSVDDLIGDLKQVRRRLELESGIDDSLRPMLAGESARTDPQQRDTSSEPAAEGDHVSTVQAMSSAEFILGEIKNHKRGLLIALVSSVLVIALFAYFSIFAKAHPIDSIAVLPFTNMSSDPNTEYLSAGLTESLINNLSQSHSLKVMSRNSVFKYSGQEADPKRVGRELGVHGVVTGRIVQRGDTISINVELIDARDDTQVWGEQFNRRMSDLSSLQEEISRQVSDKLQLRLSGDDEGRLKKRQTDDAEAYQLYLKGRFYWNKRTEEGLKKALSYFNQAIERDPSYALAYAGLADCYALLYEYSATPSKDLYPKAKAAALRALELDESLAEAHTSLAAAYEYAWNWNEAAKQYERAIELNQNYETAHHWYSAYLISRRQFDEAIRQAQRAVDLDPLSLIINTALGRALHSAKRYDEAIEQLRKTLDMDPNFAEAHFHLGLAYEGKGSYDDATRELTKAAELFGDKSMLAWVGRAYALSGRRTEALKILEDMINLSKQQQVPPYPIASLYATLGEKDRAFEWLEKVYQERNYYVVFLNVDPALDSLRSDARFSDLLGRIGLG
jgi:TolB-like protein/Flp pilus assembly protein TadD